MSNSKQSLPSTVALPSFQETFSHILQRYPVEQQQPPPHSYSVSPASRGSPLSPDLLGSSSYYDTSGPSTPTTASLGASGNGRRKAYSEFPGPGRTQYQGQVVHAMHTMGSMSRAPSHETSPSAEPPVHAIPNSDRTSQRNVEMTDSGRTRRRHVCSICDKDFLRPSSLETHMNSHTGARPHKCTFPGCDKYFSAKSNMKRHLRKHFAPDDGNQDANSDDMNDEEA